MDAPTCEYGRPPGLSKLRSRASAEQGTGQSKSWTREAKPHATGTRNRREEGRDQRRNRGHSMKRANWTGSRAHARQRRTLGRLLPCPCRPARYAAPPRREGGQAHQQFQQAQRGLPQNNKCKTDECGGGAGGLLFPPRSLSAQPGCREQRMMTSTFARRAGRLGLAGNNE
jgi:hypothetical protein